jgi:hypothetical protein
MVLGLNDFSFFVEQANQFAQIVFVDQTNGSAAHGLFKPF